MLFAFVCFSMLSSGKFGVALSLVLTLVVAAGVGLIIYNVVIYPNRKKDHVRLAILTIGIQLAVVGLASLVWGPQARIFPQLLAVQNYQFYGLIIPAGYLWTFVVALVCMLIISLVLRYTTIGLAMRVAAENVDVAQLLGVNIRLVSSIAWMTAAALGAITGILLSLSVYLSPYMIGMVILKAFAAVVLGGMSNLLGVFLGGLLLGLVEAGVAYFISPLFQDSVALLVLVVVLMLRPSGLFTSRAAWRA
jgi:branched-chain amino acid transport system permease protein